MPVVESATKYRSASTLHIGRSGSAKIPRIGRLDAFTGNYGGIVVRNRDDPLLESLTERLIILFDNRFGPDGSIDFAEPGTRQAEVDRMNGREGDVLGFEHNVHFARLKDDAHWTTGIYDSAVAV